MQSNYPILSVTISSTATITRTCSIRIRRRSRCAAKTYTPTAGRSVTNGRFSRLLTQISALHTESTRLPSSRRASSASRTGVSNAFYVLSTNEPDSAFDSQQQYETAIASLAIGMRFSTGTMGERPLYRGRPDWENDISFRTTACRTASMAHPQLALPYYEKVSYYLTTVHVRVSERTGTPACSAQRADRYLNGSYLAFHSITNHQPPCVRHGRPTSTRHGGQRNTKENKAVIDDEVKTSLPTTILDRKRRFVLRLHLLRRFPAMGL